MSALKKVTQSLGLRAMQVLGPVGYARYLLVFLTNLPRIIRRGNFSPLDRTMGSRPVKVHANGSSFLIDCNFADRTIKDDTYSFGNIREMFIKGCYLREGVEHAARRARTVLDLGANRGTFSVMMAARADKVISVEVEPVFREVIAHNMALNGFRNYAIETLFVGAGGHNDANDRSRITIPELLRKHGLDRVDLVKMDIEGSEFSLFAAPQWLDLVGALCMEIHPAFGDVQQVLDALRAHGFSVTVRGGEFETITDLKKAEYVYACRQDRPAGG